MAANSGVKLLTVEDGFFLRVGEVDSELVSFGEPLDFEVAGKKYVAFCHLDDDEANYSTPSLAFVYEVSKVLSDVEPEDAQGEDEDDEESEEEEVVAATDEE